MLFSKLEWMIALRYLRTQRKTGFISVITWFSLIGIMLGVATLIIVMSVMNGFRQELIDRFIGLDGHIIVTDHPYPIENYPPSIATLSAVEGIDAIIPVVDAQVMATTASFARGALVRGIEPTDFSKRAVLRNSVDQKALENFQKGEGLLVGNRLGRRLGLEIGQQLTLISPVSSYTAFGAIPRAKRYQVSGFFNVGMFEYDDNMIYMTLEEAQVFFQKEKAATSIEITVDDIETVDKIVEQIRPVLLGLGQIKTWYQVRAGFYNALVVERNVMFLILTLIILVAAFNIVSSQVMLVQNKGRSIAVLRTMGASRASILKIFFLTGSAIGIIGSIIGGTLGISFATNIETIRQWIQKLSGTELFPAEIYFLSRLPAKIDAMEVILVMGVALSFSFIAALYPAWRATRLDPVEVLRYE